VLQRLLDIDCVTTAEPGENGLIWNSGWLDRVAYSSQAVSNPLRRVHESRHSNSQTLTMPFGRYHAITAASYALVSTMAQIVSS
jgi:hypothetical protein